MNGNNNHNNKVNDFPEAPASWNTRYVDPNGFECQITLRGETGSQLLEKVASAINYLLENGCIPYTYRVSQHQSDVNNSKEFGNGTNGSNGSSANPAWCPIHQCEMRRWDKNGRVWYSHKVDGKWCSGK